MSGQKSDNPKLNKSRDGSMDALRGFAILLVVLGHCIQFSDLNFDKNILFRVIYSFHMPLFMFISGYVSLYSKGNPFAIFKKKANLLLLPFLTWGLVNFMLSRFKNQDKGANILTFIFQLIRSPDNNGLWFLWVLFLISMIVLIIRSLKINMEIGLFGALILLNLIFLKWQNINYLGLGLLKYYLLYYLLGLIFCRTKVHFDSFYTICIYFCCLLFPFAVIFWHRSLPPSFIAYLNLGFSLSKILWLSYQYICGILGIGLSVFFIRVLEKINPAICKLLNKIGLITLEIYAVHYYFLYFWLLVLIHFNVSVKIVIAFLLTLSCTILMINIMRKSILISFLFFGKNKNT